MVSGVLYVSSVEQFKSFFAERTQKELEVRANLFTRGIENLALNQVVVKDTSQIDSTQISFQEFTNSVGADSETRYTIVDLKGIVLADSRKKPSEMDNHRDRPEIKEAIDGGVGVSVRHSETLNTDLMYVAIKSKLGVVVRTSITLQALDKALSNYKGQVVQTIGFAVLAAILLSLFLARVISKPIEELKKRSRKLAKGDFSKQIQVTGSSEVVALSSIMNEAAQELNTRFAKISRGKERLDAVLNGMVEGVIALDKNESVFLINEAAADMLGVEISKIKGHYIQESIRNVPLQQFISQLLSKKKNAETNILNSNISVPRMGDTRILQINGTTQKRTGGCIIVLHDVTDLKRLENLRRDFAGSVSHELRTPLTSIKGFVETLIDGAVDDPKDARHFLKIINKQVNRLNQLIEDLLTISRLEKDEEDSSVELISQPIAPVILRAVSQVMKRAAEKEITISCDFKNDKILGEINESLLEQSLINLIDNAVKYSSVGSSILLGLVEYKDFVSITVSDDGPGIPSQHLSRLFERFYRVDKARTSNVGGTGLGLSIVKHIASAHNGSVSVDSVLGEGSCFKITLPKNKTTKISLED